MLSFKWPLNWQADCKYGLTIGWFRYEGLRVRAKKWFLFSTVVRVRYREFHMCGVIVVVYLLRMRSEHEIEAFS